MTTVPPPSHMDGYIARWRDREYEASPDGDYMRLYTPDPQEGFTEVAPGRYRRSVPAPEVEDFYYLRTVCKWRGEPFHVIGETGNWLRVEYVGGQEPVAAELGLDRYDAGVYQGWALRDEVTDLHQKQV